MPVRSLAVAKRAQLLSSNSFSQNYRRRQVLAVLLATIWSPTAMAADTLPLTPLDAKAVGKVSSADVGKAGDIFSGISLHTSESAVDHKALLPDHGDDTADAADRGLLADAHRGSVYLGATLNPAIQLTLGLHGSFEHVKPEARQQLGTWSPAANDTSDERQASAKESGFSGASLLLKVQLLKWQSLKVALAPFIESGAGKQAAYSLTRSSAPKAGWMGILTYGERGVAELSLNGGYRYRQPEAIGDVSLRHEAFYGAGVKTYFTRHFGFFLAAQGRTLMVASQTERDPATKKLVYRSQPSGEFNAGLMGNIDALELSAYAGTRLKQADGFGSGRLQAGLSLSYALGSYGHSATHSFAKDVEQAENERFEKAALMNPAPAAAAAVTAAPIKDASYGEMIGTDIDPLEAINDRRDDDFSRAKRQAETARQAEQGLSDDEKVSAELAKLKAAEEKAALEREAQALEEKEAARQNAIKQAQNEEKLMNEWRQEAERDAVQLEGITRDEMEWNGLEGK